MRCFEWLYQCGSCGHQFALPGADLSFLYGTFLGVSPTPGVVVLESLSDPAYAEISALVAEYSHVAEPRTMAFGKLVRAVMSSVFDTDSMQARYDFNGVRRCPQCSSGELTGGIETQTPWPEEPGPAMHTRWDALTSTEKAAEVRRVLSARSR